ncbi:MAG: O-antigen ligase family protein [Acidobacteriota bacterium]|nr:O-antigen ligase family protein [Acidobacteriota bacterium]
MGFSLLLGLVVLTPFIYGGGSGLLDSLFGRVGGPRADLLLEVAAFAIGAVTLLGRGALRSPGRLAVPIAAIMGIVALGTFQILPIPPSVLRSIAPINLRIYDETARMFALFGRNPPHPRVSIAPSSTISSFLLLLAFFSLFFSAANLLRSRERRRLFALTLFATAGIQIAMSTASAALGEGPAFLSFGLGRLAPYLEIVLALAFGALWAEVLTNRDRAPGGATDGAERFEIRSMPLVGRFLLWALFVFGIFQTGSRVALLAAILTTVAVLAIALFHRRVRFRRRRVVGMLLALLAVVLFSATIAKARPLVRFLESDPGGLNMSARVAIWKTAYRAWREFPILGSGLGTFPEAARRVQPSDLGGRLDHARSDPLQALVTGGIVGGVLAAILYLSLFLLLVAAFRDQKHREESALILGGFGALLCLSIHGLFDTAYPLTAIPAMLACVVGAAWAAARRRIS